MHVRYKLKLQTDNLRSGLNLIIGITGNSGAGKSTVSNRICDLKNAKYINADEIARELSKKRRRIL